MKVPGLVSEIESLSTGTSKLASQSALLNKGANNLALDSPHLKITVQNYWPVGQLSNGGQQLNANSSHLNQVPHNWRLVRN